MKNRAITKYILTAVAFLALSGGMGAWGATVTWDGNTDADGNNIEWSDPLNWNTNTVPAVGDDVVIPLAANITMPLTATTVLSITCTGGATLNLQNNITLTDLVFNTASLVTINLNDHGITASGTMRIGNTTTGNVRIIGGGGSTSKITCGILDTCNSTNNFLNIRNYADITVTTTFYANQDATRTTDISGDGTGAILLQGGGADIYWGIPALTVSNVTISATGSSYTFTVLSGTPGPGNTVNVRLYGPIVVDSGSRYYYYKAIVKGSGDTHTVAGTSVSATTAVTALAPAAQHNTNFDTSLTFATPLAAGEGMSVTFYQPDGITPLGTVTYYQGTNVWKGGSAGHETEWEWAANWSSGSIPTTGDIIIPKTTYAPSLGLDRAYTSVVIEDQASLSLNGHTLTVSTIDVQGTGKITAGTGTLNFAGTASWTCARPAYSPLNHVTIAGALTLASDMTVTRDWTRTGTFTPSGKTVTFAGTSTLGNNESFAGLTVATGSSLDIGTHTLATTGALTNNGTVTLEGSSGQITAASVVNGGSSTVAYSGAAADPDAWGTSYRNLTVTGTLSLGTTSISVPGTLTVSGQLNLDDTGSVSSIGTLANNGMIVLSSSGAIPNSDSDSGTFRYTAGWTGTIPALDGFYDLDITGGAHTQTNDLTVNGDLTISGGSLAGDANDITVTGSITGAGALTGGTGTITVGGEFSPTAFSQTGGTLELNGTVASFAPSGSIANLTLGASADVTLGANLTMTGTLDNTAGGALDANNRNISVAGSFTNGGTFTSGTGTVTMTGTGTLSGFTGASALRNLTVNSAGTVTLGSSILVSGDGAGTGGNVTITAGTLTAGANGITLDGDWTNNDTFDYDTGTVTFRNSNGDTAHAIGGTNTFYNLTCSGAAAALAFPSSVTTTIAPGGTLTLGGTSTAARLTLGPSIAATTWTLDVRSSVAPAVQYLTVTYCDLVSSNAALAANLAPVGSSGGTGNDSSTPMWVLSTSYTWNGPTPTTVWNDAANWTPNTGYPVAGDDVTIPDLGATLGTPEIPAGGISLKDLTLDSGAKLSLAGKNLTVTGTSSKDANATILVYGDEATVSPATLLSTGITEYNGTAATYTIADIGATDYATLRINSASAEYTFSADLDVSGSITVVQSNGVVFPGTLDAPSLTVTTSNASTAIRVGGTIAVTTLSPNAGPYDIALLGGGTVTDPVTFLNTGTVQLGNAAGDAITFGGGIAGASATSGLMLAGTIATTNDALTLNDVITLVANATLQSGSGTMTVGGTVDSATDTDYDLTVSSTTGTLSWGGAIGAGDDLGNLEVSTGSTIPSLTIAGNLTLNGGTTALSNANHSIGGDITGAETLNAIAIAGNSLNVDGSVGIPDGAALAAFSGPTSGTFTVGGGWNVTAHTNNGATITFDGTTPLVTIASNGQTLGPVAISKSASTDTVALSGGLTCGQITLTQGTFDADTNNVDVSCAGFVDTSANASFTGAGQTVTVTGGNLAGQDFSNLSIAGTVTATGDATAAGDFTLTSGTLDMTGGTYLLDVAGNIALAGGTLALGSLSSLEVAGNVTRTSGVISSTAGATGTVTLNGAGAGAQTANFTGSTIPNLATNKTGGSSVVRLDNTAAFTWNGNCSFTAGTLELPNLTQTIGGSVTGTGTLDADAITGTLTVSGSVGINGTPLTNLNAPEGTLRVGANWNVTNLTNTGTGTRVVEFTDDGTIYSASQFVNLAKSGAGTTTAFNAAVPIDVTGNVSIPSGTLELANVASQTITGNVTGSGTLDADAVVGTLIVSGSVGTGTALGTLLAPTGTIRIAGPAISGTAWNVTNLTPGSGTVEFNGTSGAQTIVPNGQSFNAVTMTGTAGVSMAGTATFTTLSIGNGEAFTLGGAIVTQLTLSGTGANVLVTGTSGGLRWNAASASSTLTFSGAAPQISNGNSQGLQVTSGTNNANLTATNTVTLTGSELDPNGQTLRIGNFTTAVAHNLVAGDILTLSGPATFSNGLTLNGDAATRVNVGAQTLTVTNPTITYGTMTVTSGEIACGASTLDIASSNGALTSTGASTLGAGAVSNAGTITINTTTPISWSTSGNFTSTGTMANDIAYTIAVGGNLAISGTYDTTPLPTFSMSGGGNTVNTAIQIGNLTTTGTAVITAVTNQLKLAGALTLGTGTTLDLSTLGADIAGNAGGTGTAALDGGGATGNTVNIDGNFTVPNYTATSATTTIAGQTVTFTNLTHSGGTITLDGTATPVALTTGGSTFNKLSLSSTGAKTVNVSGTLNTESASATGTLNVGTNCTLNVGNNQADIGGATTNSGTITLGTSSATFRALVTSTSGTLTSGSGTVNLDGGLNAAGGAFTASGNTTYVGLSLTAGTALSLPAAPNFSANGGTIAFNGVSGSVTFATNGQTVNNLTIDNNTAAKTVVLSGNLTVAGALEVETDQTLDTATNDAQLSVTGATNGTAGNAGTITADAGALSFTGDFQLANLTASTGNTTFRGNVILHTFAANSGTVVFAGNTATPTLTPNGATFNAISVTRTGGTLSTAGAPNGSFTATSYSQTGVGGTFTLAATDTMTLAASGSVTVSAGRLNLYGTYAGGSASLTVSGTAPNAGQVYAQGLAFSADSLTATGDGLFSQSVDNGANVQTVGDLTVSGNGVCVWDSGNNGGNLVVTRNLTGTANLNFHYKNVRFEGTNPNGILSGTVTFMDLYIPSGRRLFRSGSSNMTVLRHLTIENGGQYVHNSRPLTLGGTVPIAITIGTIDDRNTGGNPLQNLGDVTLAAGGVGTVKTLANPMRALSVGVGANVSFNLATYNLTVDNDLTGTGILTVSAGASQTIDVGQDLTTGTINFTGASPTVQVARNMTLGTLTAGSSTFVLDGTGSQTINPNAQNLYNLTIENRASGTVTFNTSALTVTNGTAGQGLVVNGAAGDAYNVTIGNGGSAANATTFNNEGTLAIASGYTFTAGVVHTAGATSLGGTLATSNAAAQFAALSLSNAAAINTVNAGTGGNVSIGGNVTNATAYSLTLTAGSAGDVHVTGSIGSGTALGAISIVSANDVTFDSTVNAASLAQTAGSGTTTFHGNVTTGGNAAVDLTATAIAIDSGTGVTIQGNGATGTLYFRAPVTISSGPATVSALSQGITFTSAINGAQALAVRAGTTTAQPASFQAALGTTTPLASFEASGSTVGLVDVGTAAVDGVTGTLSVTGTDAISLTGSNYRSGGDQTWSSPAGVRYLATVDGTWRSGGATGITLNATDLFLDHSGRTLTLGCNLSCRSLYFYRGALNSPGVAIRSTGDIAIFGSGYSANDPQWDGNNDASIADADDWRFAYYLASPLAYYPGGGTYTNGAFSVAPSASFLPGISTSVVVDSDGNGTGNLYANGVSLAAFTLALAVPANASSAPAFNNGIAPVAAQWGLPYAAAFYLDGAGATVSGGWLAGCPAQGVTATGAGNWQYSRPTIALAETVYDDVVRLTFSMPVENDNGEIAAAIALAAAVGDDIDDGSVWLNYALTHYKFAGAYSDAKCATPLPAGDVTSFYIKTTGARWNTDATGTSAGDTDASDGTASTDRGRAGIAPVTQSTVPDLAFLEGLFRAADGKTMCQNYGANTVPQYAATVDRCAPVLIEAFTGQEAHLTADSDAAQAPYDAHNFIEFRWSEPVLVPGVLQSDVNVLATAAAGMVAQSGPALDVAGIGLIASGTLSSGARAYDTTAVTTATHALYRRFSLAGGAVADQPQRMRVSIAGYAETGASHGESYAWYWPGFVTAAATPSGAVTASATSLAITDVAANAIDEIAAGTYDRAAVTLSTSVSGLYGPWDVTGPAPAALRTSTDAWGDEIVAYEAVPDTTGGIIDRIELHLFDNEVSYDAAKDTWAWYSRKGWYESSDSTKTILSQASAAAPEAFGGSRPVNSPSNAYVATSGGIRESSLNQALAAFRVFYNDAIMSSLPTAFSTNVSTKLLAPGTNQNVAGDPYFRLYWPGAGGSGYQIAGAALTLSYNADGNPTQGYVTDLAGNVLKPFSKIKCVDRTAPRITFSLAGADRSDLYVLFSKTVEFNDPSEIAAGLTVNLSGTPVALSGTPEVKTANKRAFLYRLASPVTAANLVSASSAILIAGTGNLVTDPVTGITSETSYFVDELGNYAVVGDSHRLSDIGIGLVDILYGSDGVNEPGLLGTDGGGALRPEKFDGTGRLLDKDITIATKINLDSAPGSLSLYYDVNPDESAMPKTFNEATGSSLALWLPSVIPGFNQSGDQAARNLSPVETTKDKLFRNFLIPESDAEVVPGAKVQFLLQYEGLFCARLTNESDITSLAPWSFVVAETRHQRGGVTILNNVINSDKREKTILQVEVPKAGSVVIQVFTLDGNIVKVLERGRKGGGTYSYYWDGTNGAGNPVTRGIYFIRVVGPDMDEIRKVLVVRD